ncbi:MAG TPA: FAD-binding protein [Candidatus Acidoferrum sp.]|nr:FAD-binding protein [Candidatus Acidoferrum sp.]
MNSSLLSELRHIVGPRNLITSPEELHTYDSDALTNFRAMPRAVLLPNSTAEVQAILRLCHREQIPFVARSPGASPERGYNQFTASFVS